MRSSVRLVINTGATYVRSLLNVGLSLFSSRWVLNGLGVVDYGLFALVGSVLLFVGYLNGVMASASSRYFAYTLGQGESSELKSWFNVALSIHLCFALSLVVVGFLCGNYIIYQMLHIPIERKDACFFVYQVSLLSLFSGMVSVPFLAMFRATQNIVELSVWNMLQTVLTFSLALSLLYAKGDRLKYYAVSMTAILLFVHLGQMIRAVAQFEGCKVDIRLWFAKDKIKKIFSFASWNLIGTSGFIFRNEGSSVLLNMYFGPTVNAAYGITKRVSLQVDQLSAAMLGAFAPEITAREGRGQRESMIRLSLQACKFGTLISLVFVVPLFAEIDYVLHGWLGSPPEYTSSLCRYILLTYLIDRLSSGYMIAINAHGRIAAYQATVGLLQLLTLPLGWLCIVLGYSPVSIGLAFVITMVAVTLGRILWAYWLFGVPFKVWWSMVFLPCLVVGVVSGISAIVPIVSLPVGYFRFIMVVGLEMVSFVLITWFFALDGNEKKFMDDVFNKVLIRIRKIITN